jgi:integrase
VQEYLALLERAGRSKRTIKTYRDSFLFFARFLDVPLEELHNNLTVDNLMEYFDSDRVKKLSANSKRIAMAAISRYMRLNGVEFDELELGVVRARKPEVRCDKPPELETLRAMMDLADTQMKAYITFLISTGCRAGETAQILLSDVNGSVVTIRSEIAKGHRGGKVFLTEEAREYLDLWVRERSNWIEDKDWRVKNMGKQRPKHDERLFGCSYGSLSQHFARLYNAVDGEKTPMYRYDRGMLTPHSCRAYFRTHAATTMGIDLVEGIMRHTGYLNASYVRMSDEERERLFHEGEAALYITRADQRITKTEIEKLKRERDEQAGEISALQQDVMILKKVIAEINTKKKS